PLAPSNKVLLGTQGCKSLPAARTRASCPGRPTSWTYGGSASAGQPSALNGYVNIVPGKRIVSSSTSAGGATNGTVGVTSRSTPASASSTRSPYSSRSRAAVAASASVASRQRSILPRTFSPYS